MSKILSKIGKKKLLERKIDGKKAKQAQPYGWPAIRVYVTRFDRTMLAHTFNYIFKFKLLHLYRF